MISMPASETARAAAVPEAKELPRHCGRIHSQIPGCKGPAGERRDRIEWHPNRVLPRREDLLGGHAPQPSIGYLALFLAGTFLAGAFVLVLHAISVPV